MTVGIRPQPSGFTPDADAQDASLPDDGFFASKPARVFYGIDSRRVSVREFWWGSPVSILFLPYLKLFRIPGATDDPNVESLAPFEVDVRQVPGTIVQRFSLSMHQLQALGFRSPVWHVIEDDVNRIKTHLATLTHESGRTWARVHQRSWHGTSPVRTHVFCEFVTELAGGRFLWSLSSKPDLAAPSSCTVVRIVGASPSRLMAAHQSALTKIGASSVQLVTTTDELRAGVDRHHATVRDYHLARGVFAPLTVDEHQTAVAFRTSVKSAEDEGSRYPEILAEVDRLQNAKSSRASAVILLLVSLGLFFGAGLTNVTGNKFSADILFILVGVLFFHEAGHWVAMRMFGYRNLKMFFIPFFGAAVSGRHYNVAGWKKAIVSLMGPLPGIVVGAAVGALGVMLHEPLLIKISLVSLLLNGFNLLPILPLDGGWIVQAILFSRHHLLELLFRLAALAALIGIAIVSSDNVLIGVSVAMALSLPAMYKLARITNELRRANLPAASDDGQTLPQATADAIVDRIKAAFSPKLSNKMAAHHTLQVFENLNARPPGILASIGLGILQFGSIAASAGIAALIYFGGQEGTWHSAAVSSLVVVRTPGDSALATPQNFVVATFPKLGEELVAVAELQRHASPAIGVERLGQTVLVALPLEDVDGLRDVQSALERHGATAFVGTPDEPAGMRLRCTATSVPVGKELEAELAGYLNGRGLNLLPPWQPGVPLSDAQRAQHRKARDTYRSLKRALSDAHADPAAVALVQGIEVAESAGDSAQLARLESQRIDLVAGLQRDRLRALRGTAGIDTAVVDAYAAIEVTDGDTAAFHRREAVVAPLLGQLPLVDGRPATGTEAWSVSGPVGVDSAAVMLPYLRFTNVFQGAPALVRWLHANGCGDIEYNFGVHPARMTPAGVGLRDAGGWQ